MKARYAIVGIAALAVAGCSSSSSGGTQAPPTSPGTTTPAGTASASASASSSATAPASPTPTPSFSSTVHAAGACGAKELSVSLGQAQGSAGHTEQPILFTNVGSHGCTLYGHPGASFVDAQGNEVGPQAQFDDEQQATVTLAPGGVANSILSIPDPGVLGPAECQEGTAAQLRVYPPGVRKAYLVADPATICTSTNSNAAITDSPVTPGNGS